MKLVYNGPHPEVDVHIGDGAFINDIPKGQPVEIPTSVAEVLLEQTTWSTEKPAPAVATPPVQRPAPLTPPQGTGA